MRLPTPTLYAHRGASLECPENTIPAFERALEIGADALELDVHVTRDGQVVVSHDPSGQRMCNVSSAIERTTWREIAGWNAGWNFVDAAGQHSFRDRGVQVPLLREVLAAFPGTPLNIDVKARAPDAPRIVVELFRRSNVTDCVRLTSFSSRTIRELRREGWEGATGLARNSVLFAVAAPAALARRVLGTDRAAQIPHRLGAIDFGTRAVISRLHAAGLRVDYWTVNEPELALRLLRAGADGIMTDDPAAIVDAVRGFARERDSTH